MFEKVMNKKGQEGLTLTTLLLIVLGIVVVVVIIIGATSGFDFIFGKVNQLPGQTLEAITQGCGISAQQTLITDYCYDFKKLDDNTYINCQDARVKDSLTQKNIDVSFNCNSELVMNAEVELCKGITPGKQNSTVVVSDISTNCADVLNTAGISS